APTGRLLAARALVPVALAALAPLAGGTLGAGGALLAPRRFGAPHHRRGGLVVRALPRDDLHRASRHGAAGRAPEVREIELVSDARELDPELLGGNVQGAHQIAPLGRDGPYTFWNLHLSHSFHAATAGLT